MSLQWGKTEVLHISLVAVKGKVAYTFVHIAAVLCCESPAVFGPTRCRFSPGPAVPTGCSVRSGTPGATLLPTESRPGERRQTLIGLSPEEAQEEVVPLWPHSPASCKTLQVLVRTSRLQVLTDD